jgi:hypothetical protein
VVAAGAGAAVPGAAVGVVAAEGELTSSAQEAPEAGWKEDAVAFILRVAVFALKSGFVMRSASEPLAGVFGVAMLDMQVAVVAMRYGNVHSSPEKKKVLVGNLVLKLEMNVGCE